VSIDRETENLGVSVMTLLKTFTLLSLEQRFGLLHEKGENNTSC
jgi:hypothetical protein